MDTGSKAFIMSICQLQFYSIVIMFALCAEFKSELMWNLYLLKPVFLAAMVQVMCERSSLKLTLQKA